jgi:hypothetical protein
MSPRHRTIIHTPKYVEELATFLPNVRRADDFIEGSEWVLSRLPDIGTQLTPTSEVWFLPMDENPDLPSLVLYYTFTDDLVWFLSIQMANDSEGDLN